MSWWAETSNTNISARSNEGAKLSSRGKLPWQHLLIMWKAWLYALIAPFVIKWPHSAKCSLNTSKCCRDTSCFTALPINLSGNYEGGVWQINNPSDNSKEAWFEDHICQVRGTSDAICELRSIFKHFNKTHCDSCISYVDRTSFRIAVSCLGYHHTCDISAKYIV